MPAGVAGRARSSATGGTSRASEGHLQRLEGEPASEVVVDMAPKAG